MIAQSIAIKNAVEQNFPTIDHITTPIYNADGTEIINSAGYYIDGFGRVIVDEKRPVLGFSRFSNHQWSKRPDKHRSTYVDNAVITSPVGEWRNY